MAGSSSSQSPPSRSTISPRASSTRRGSGGHDLILVSQILFGSGRRFDGVDELASLARPDGPWVVIDGYHAFMAIERPFAPAAAQKAFFLGGGYKYAMAGEGMGFMHCPPGFGPRPPLTGWFAEFDDLTLAPGAGRLRQGRDALHGRDVRSVGALPLQPCPADAR